MSRFNTVAVERLPVADTTNYAGGEAFTQTPKQEFVSILLTSMVKDQFYRSGDDTITRLVSLMDQIIASDPNGAKFVAKAALYARDEFGMRSVSHVVAAELARRVKGQSWTKDFFNRIVVRADDMTEIMAYYISRYGKPVPNALKKGFAMAFNRLDSYKLAKYRGEGKAVSLVDVVNIVRPKPTSRNAKALSELVAGTLRNTGTWEAKMSAAGSNTEAKADVWTGLIDGDKMPYFALLRNLRNIEQTGNEELITKAARQLVEDDPGSHRILPFRFLTAYGEVTHRKLVSAVSDALDLATVNVPSLPGRSLIVVDHSGSMRGFSHGTPQFIGDTFASVLYKSNDADVMVFGTNAGYVNGLNPADSTLTLAQKIGNASFGHGTNFHAIFQTASKAYERIFIFSDMQGWIGYSAPTSALRDYEKKTGCKPFVYSFDLAGLGTTQFPEKRIVQLGGFSEKIFDTMQLVESDPNALVNKIESIDL